MKEDLMTKREVVETLDIAVKKAMDEVNKIPMEQWESQGFDLYFKLERLLEREVYDTIENYGDEGEGTLNLQT